MSRKETLPEKSARKEAEILLREARTKKNPEALRRFLVHPKLAHLTLEQLDPKKLKQKDAYQVVALENGFENWPQMLEAVRLRGSALLSLIERVRMKIAPPGPIQIVRQVFASANEPVTQSVLILNEQGESIGERLSFGTEAEKEAAPIESLVLGQFRRAGYEVLTPLEAFARRIAGEHRWAYVAQMPIVDNHGHESWHLEVEIDEGTIAGSFDTGVGDDAEVGALHRQLMDSLDSRGMNVFWDSDLWEEFNALHRPDPDLYRILNKSGYEIDVESSAEDQLVLKCARDFGGESVCSIAMMGPENVTIEVTHPDFGTRCITFGSGGEVAESMDQGLKAIWNTASAALEDPAERGEHSVVIHDGVAYCAVCLEDFNRFPGKKTESCPGAEVGAERLVSRIQVGEWLDKHHADDGVEEEDYQEVVLLSQKIRDGAELSPEEKALLIRIRAEWDEDREDDNMGNGALLLSEDVTLDEALDYDVELFGDEASHPGKPVFQDLVNATFAEGDDLYDCECGSIRVDSCPNRDCPNYRLTIEDLQEILDVQKWSLRLSTQLREELEAGKVASEEAADERAAELAGEAGYPHGSEAQEAILADLLKLAGEHFPSEEGFVLSVVEVMKVTGLPSSDAAILWSEITEEERGRIEGIALRAGAEEAREALRHLLSDALM